MRFYTAAEGHLVLAQPPIDAAAAAINSDVWSMKNWAHASIIIQVGATGAVSTVTLEECDDFTPSTSTAIAFEYYEETTAGGDTLSVKKSATASGFATTAANNTFYVIEIDSAALSEGFPNLRVAMTDPGATPMLTSILVVLSQGRYSGEASATVLS